mgnify:FL=1|tara:strand:+ start:1252 stop:1980 length:729 start_codon:yes stop_codon:yes gene_type:complete
MVNYRIKKYRGLKVCYLNELDGGGTSFGQDYLSFIPRLSKKKFGRAYEWCAGPGFIGFSLLANGFCDSLCLSDVHPPAIAALKETVKINGLENKVSIYHSDSLDNIPNDEKWNIVVGNPPHYKKDPTIKNLSEDNIRIVLDKDLNIHKRFFNKINQYLSSDGIILLQENWHRVALDDFREMLVENNIDFKFSSPFSNKFYYLCAANKENNIKLLNPPSWSVKYTNKSFKGKIKTLIKNYLNK